MKISSRARYATRILIYLAGKRGHAPVRKHEIAKNEGISPDYVEQILINLRAAGLVASQRGPAGGFVLTIPPEKISVKQIIEAVDGPVALAPCLVGACDRVLNCPARRLWHETSALLARKLAATNVAQLAEQADSGKVPTSLWFEI